MQNGPIKHTHRQWNWLEVTDRASGTTRRISLGDAEIVVDVGYAAHVAGLSPECAWDVLRSGQEITTAAYVRRLAE